MLRRPGLARSLVAYVFSEVGDGFTTVALPLYVLAQTGDPVAVGATFAAEVGFATLFGLLGGPTSDRFNRKRIVLITFVLRASLLVAASQLGSTMAVVALVILAKVIGAFDNPAMEAAIPDLAGDSFQAASALRNIGRSGAFAIGPALGGLTVGVAGPQTAFLIDAASFLTALLVFVGVTNFDPESEDRKRSFRDNGETLKQELTAGFGQLTSDRLLRRFVGYQFVSMSLVALVLAAAPIYVISELGASELAYGIVIGGFGVGTALSLAWFGRSNRLGNKARVLLIASILYGIFFVAGVAVASVVALWVSWLALGLAFGPEQIVIDLMIVEKSPPKIIGRVYSAFGIVLSLGSVVGFIISGPLVAATSARSVMVMVGAAFPLAGIAFFARSARKPPG